MNEIVMKHLITSGIDTEHNRKLIEIGELGYQLDSYQNKIDKFAVAGDHKMMTVYEKEFKRVYGKLATLMNEII